MATFGGCGGKPYLAKDDQHIGVETAVKSGHRAGAVCAIRKKDSMLAQKDQAHHVRIEAEPLVANEEEAMSKLDCNVKVAAWLHRPLCCRYGGVFMRSHLVRVEGQPIDGGPHIHWAMACNAGDGSEVLGAWSGSESVGVDPREVMSDLYSRGVERITTLIGNDLSGMKTPVSSNAQRKRRRALDVLEVAPTAELSTARSTLQRTLLAGEQQAQGIEKRLLRYVTRHGNFSDDAAALEFVATHLMRAEQKLDQDSVDRFGAFRSKLPAISLAARL